MTNSFDESTLFLTNKNGFPIDQQTWQTMWKFAKFQYPKAEEKIEEIQALKASELSQVKIPTPPLTFPSGLSIAGKVWAVQKYFNELQYNHTGTQFFEIKKYRSLTGLMDDAKLMIKESLPIKCLEAVVLGIHLTNKIDDLVRFPIGFKSSFEGSVHRHVVLGLYSRGAFGAVGISRRQDLMYKQMAYKTLTDLILDYTASYRRHWHSLKRVKIGGSVTQNVHSFEPIPWQGATVFPCSQSPADLRSELERYSKLLRHGGSYPQQLQYLHQQHQQKQNRMVRSASLPTLNDTSRNAASPKKTGRKKSNYFLRV